jgi:glycosyltransferase involved in cell wall biosynthesis
MFLKTPLKVLLADPSLFTGPYDGALTRGLLEAGARPSWVTRPVRAGDRPELPPDLVDDFFYRHVDAHPALQGRLRTLAKGLAHAAGLARLVARAWGKGCDLVHFQWTVLPSLDALAIRLIRWRRPVVLTVHDTVPFNGQKLPLLQRLGYDGPIRQADRVIVLTASARDRLLERGIPGGKVVVVPHGPMPLPLPPSPEALRLRDPSRLCFLIFGEIKPYKGIDVMIEALALLPASERQRVSCIVAGRPRMDLGPLQARIAQLGLDEVVDLRPRRQSDQEMVDLFAQADCFVMPYRQIDASGVYYQVKDLGRWIIASRVGVFAEDLRDGQQGRLIAPDDVRALANALAEAIARPRTAQPGAEGIGWRGIAHKTLSVYREALEAHRPAHRPVPSARDAQP